MTSAGKKDSKGTFLIYLTDLALLHPEQSRTGRTYGSGDFRPEEG